MASIYGTLTLGELIEALEQWVSKNEEEAGGRVKALDRRVYFAFGWAIPTRLASYRGHYDHLALGYTAGGDHTGKTIMVRELLAELKGSVGKTHTGWKGGDYEMGLETPVWVDNPGHTSSTMILGMVNDTYDCHIRTAQEDDRAYWYRQFEEDNHVDRGLAPREPDKEQDEPPKAKCGSGPCEADAVALVHWNGKEVLCCEDCGRGMNNLSQHMGWGDIIFTSLATGQTMVFKKLVGEGGGNTPSQT